MANSAQRGYSLLKPLYFQSSNIKIISSFSLDSSVVISEFFPAFSDIEEDGFDAQLTFIKITKIQEMHEGKK